MIQAIRKRMNQKGFTLVELMVVIAILGVLAAIAIPKFSESTAAANTAKIQADLRTIESAVLMAQAAGEEATYDNAKKYLKDEPKIASGKFFSGANDVTIASGAYGVADDGTATFTSGSKAYTLKNLGRDGTALAE